MVRATFRPPFGGHSPANRDRLCARRDQPQRISPPQLVVASPDRRCGLAEVAPAGRWSFRDSRARVGLRRALNPFDDNPPMSGRPSKRQKSFSAINRKPEFDRLLAVCRTRSPLDR